MIITLKKERECVLKIQHEKKLKSIKELLNLFNFKNLC
jgi:hypothetical protein